MCKVAICLQKAFSYCLPILISSELEVPESRISEVDLIDEACYPALLLLHPESCVLVRIDCIT